MNIEQEMIVASRLKMNDKVIIEGSSPYEPAEMIMRVIYVARCEHGYDVVLTDEHNNYRTKHMVVKSSHAFVADVIEEQS